MIPGCIGAKRKDRIPSYFKRSVVWTTLLMLPLFAVQFFAGPIMYSLGVKKDIAHEVGVYCRLMVITSLLLNLDCHIETIMVNLGYTRCAAFNSGLSGLGIDVVGTYFLIYKWKMGTEGAALAQIAVKSSRLLVWFGLILYYGLFDTICVGVSKKKDPIFSWKEFKIFINLSLPAILSNFSGWFIFELQIMCLANIQGRYV